LDHAEHERLIGLLRRVLRDCGKLYQSSARLMLRRYPTMIQGDVSRFQELMEDLHRGLLIKVYVTIVRADDRWTIPEKKVATAMIEYLWGESFTGHELREAATGLFAQADALRWDSLVAPFVRYPPLADSKADVETVVMRLANLVAKCDGQTMPEESMALHELQREMDAALRPESPQNTLAPLSPSNNQQTQYQPQTRSSSVIQAVETNTSAGDANGPPDEIERAERLTRAMNELKGLIGLSNVKERVRSYANFLKLQQTRRESGLTTMPISLHMAFTGNPGTGKTTVARIIGQILGAMGTLPSGHVVETDRSGLVGQYAGQTAPKTNALCDSARGGVLFIDEAYSLVDAKGDDAYGREAIQTLLKRMEDDRESMAVILAGYTGEMDEMIKSNPGLSSRINTRIEFDDYGPAEMGRIFERMCNQNQYDLPAAARHRLLIGFHELFEKRDRHFGNGRLVRNAFEDSVRALADRIAEVSVLSEDLLSKLTEADISVPSLKRDQVSQKIAKPHRLTVRCGGCQSKVRIEAKSLGGRIRCTKCHHVQDCDWADVEW
jgi:AAA+ superfamily predicted ATPase/tellurite resistance protein